MALLPFLPGTLLRQADAGRAHRRLRFLLRHGRSRIVGIIGSSSNPISGMTIATLMATCLIFVGIGLDGRHVPADGAVRGRHGVHRRGERGRDSQDFKTGYLVGATPSDQQIGLMIGVRGRGARHRHHHAACSITPTPSCRRRACTTRSARSKFPAPQGTLMATIIKGLLAFNLDWQFVLVGVFLAVTMRALRRARAVLGGRRLSAAVDDRAHLRRAASSRAWRNTWRSARASTSRSPSSGRATSSPRVSSLAGARRRRGGHAVGERGPQRGHLQAVRGADPAPRGGRERLPASSACWPSPSWASCCTASRAGPRRRSNPRASSLADGVARSARRGLSAGRFLSGALDGRAA